MVFLWFSYGFSTVYTYYVNAGLIIMSWIVRKQSERSTEKILHDLLGKTWRRGRMLWLLLFFSIGKP